jgi:Tfp pilus assembly protein PilO
MSHSAVIPKTVRQKKHLCQIAGASLAIAIVAAWVFLSIQPLRSVCTGLQYEEQSFKQLQQHVEQILTQSSKALAQLEHWKQQNQTRLDRSASKLDTAEFLSWVNEQSEAAGLMVRDFRPSGRESQPDYDGQCITLSGHGSFESISLFLDQFRQCPRMNRITTIEIVPRDSERTTYQLTLGVVVYTFNPKDQKAQP